jgi:hypothetical protein
MNEQWFCLDCRTLGPLTLHLRCATCGSDSVASEATHAPFMPTLETFEIAELKRIFAL